ncbi:hypothetical protein [Methylomonas rivi]|uniref:Lipoprotein n=1 Tax=Methylomonas rivi TaxID=2952226 RepID=A0ABT1U5W1_9GAMM|nr:hypothetical protein [Methylomonas sp. WSC-6]MCQ8129192.1 hypothetical protein [Methylomonas sp. WSC-6]
MKLIARIAIGSLLAAGLQGCISPLALDHAVMAYDQTTTEIQSKQLLLNIARAHRHQPLHFTGVSNIAATFNFQFNAGATPAMTGESGSLLTPIFGGTVSENPTISIVPIEGEEFTRRLLTPFQENKLTMLLRQGADIDLILRLLAGELRIKGDKQDSVCDNSPKDRQAYRCFRQFVTHLSSIQDRRLLFVEPLMFDRSWQVAADSLTAEQRANLQKEFKVKPDISGKALTITQRVTGRVILSNYDPQRLSNEERIKLNDDADDGAMNDVMVDIRPDYPGGELPLHGFFRLRSFYNVLNFIGRGLDDQPEFSVDKHPNTPAVTENPIETLGISVSENQPEADSVIEYEGLYYAVTPETGYQWNREGFRLLHQIFQMTMAVLPQQAAPQITISK